MFSLYLAPKMRQLIKVVVPKVAHCWEKVAYFLEIDSSKIKLIKKQHPNEPEDSCIELFDHWLSSGEGVQPKTWGMLLETLKEIKQLTEATKEIEKHLEKL